MRKLSGLLAPAFTLLLCIPVAEASPVTGRPKIGLALSGGGAKGCAHVGVLRELEAMNVPIDYIAGTSMGSVVGALYASGMSPDEIERELATIDWNEALTDSTAYRDLVFRRKREILRYPSTAEVGFRGGKLVVPTGLRTGQKLTFLLGRYLLPHLDERDFSRLPVPFAAVAADLETGEPVVLSGGDLAEAVRASMSIPGAFMPVDWQGRILVDGGVAMNVPVDTVRAMGADVVIAVDIGSPLEKREKLTSTFGVLGQLTTMLTRANMTPQLAKADLVLVPDVAEFGTFAFEEVHEIVRRGSLEAEAKREALARYAVAPEESAARLAAHRTPRERPIVVDAIEISGAEVVSENLIRQQLTTKAGEPLDLERLQADVEWLYGWGDFIGIHFGLERRDDRHVLQIRVQEKPWGPNYVRTGITFSASTEGTDVNFLLNYTRRWINERGAEWRNDLVFGENTLFETELYQPRQFHRPGFVSAGGGYRDNTFDLWVDDRPVAEYRVKQLYAFADAGLQLRSRGELRTGLFARSTNAKIETGSLVFPTLDIDDAGLSARFLYDSLDNPFIPRSGAAVELQVVAPLEAFGSEGDYATVKYGHALFADKGRHTASARLFAQDTVTGEPTAFDFTSLGGFGKLSGYAPAQLIDEAGIVLGLGYYYKIAELAGIGEGAYAGVVLEAGDVYPSLSDIDVGDFRLSATALVGFSTNYGPVFLALSKAKDNELQFSLTVGRSF